MFRYGETRWPAIKTTFTGGPATFRYGETQWPAIKTTFTGGPAMFRHGETRGRKSRMLLPVAR
jgi:hypothetical protein